MVQQAPQQPKVAERVEVEVALETHLMRKLALEQQQRIPVGPQLALLEPRMLPVQRMSVLQRMLVQQQ